MPIRVRNQFEKVFMGRSCAFRGSFVSISLQPLQQLQIVHPHIATTTIQHNCIVHSHVNLQDDLSAATAPLMSLLSGLYTSVATWSDEDNSLVDRNLHILVKYFRHNIRVVRQSAVETILRFGANHYWNFDPVYRDTKKRCLH